MIGQDDEALLERVLSGDAQPSDSEVRARCADEPEFERRLNELVALRGLLETDAVSERAALDTGSDSGHRSEGPASAGPGARLARWPLFALAAAAALVALFAVAQLFGGDDPVHPWADRTLGSAPLTGLAPSGEGVDFATFRFDPASIRDPQRIFERTLRIWADDAPADAAAHVEVEIEGAVWSPTEAQLAGLPDAIRWEVVLSDVEGVQVQAGFVVHASR